MTGLSDWLLIGGGILAGMVNTVSGSGTLFSLGVMALTDIPLVIANIATRPGVFFQNITGIYVLRRYRKFNKNDIRPGPVIHTGMGAMAGAVCASIISANSFNLIASLVMVVLLLQYIVPRHLPRFDLSIPGPLKKSVQATLFFLAGFYGGFIQIGIGILILTLLFRYLAIPYTRANAYKLIIITVYTFPTTLYFAFTDKILWRPALLLALGQILGAYLAAVFISVNSNAKLWAKWVTVMMIAITLVKIWFF